MNEMQFNKMIKSLARFGDLLPATVSSIEEADARWRPENGAWSILEVVCHLGDEEEFDFGTRVRRTLEDPAREWPSIDPEGWAKERRYNDADLEQAVERFRRLRQGSVAWLQQLCEPNWDLEYQHPQFGTFRAGDIFASWVAHDYLHLRQIAKRMYEMANRDAGKYSSRYAGDWVA